MADSKFYTIAGAAELKGTTYPTVRKAIDSKKLVPVKANVGLKNAREIELLSGEQLDAWTPQRRSRLSEDERIKRAAKMLGITPEAMKAALKVKK